MPCRVNFFAVLANRPRHVDGFWAKITLLALLLVFFYVVEKAFIALCFGTGFEDYIPHYSDQLLYWKQVANLRGYLLHTGYFGHEELLSGLNRLGINSPGASHGLCISLFYSLCSLPVWTFATPLYVNIVLTSLGLWAAVVFSNNDCKTTLLTICSLLCLYPFYYFNAYNSFQSVQVLVAGFAAVVVVRLLNSPDAFFDWRLVLALVAVVGFGALLRKDWALLMISAMLLPASRRRQRVVALLEAVAAVFVLSTAFDASRSPYPYKEFSEDLRPLVLPTLARGDLHPLLSHCANNLKIFAQFIAKRDFATVYATFLVCMAGLFSLALPSGPLGRRLRCFNLLSLSLVLTATLGTYYLFQIMVLKVVFPLFILLLLVNIRFLPPKLIVAFLALNLLFLPKFLGYCQTLAPEYDYPRWKRHSIETFARQTAPFLPCSSEDRWKNTVLTFGYPQEMLGLPPCISFMDTREAFLQKRDYVVHTGYVLVDDKAMEERLLAQNHLRLLTPTSAGNLYAVENAR